MNQWTTFNDRLPVPGIKIEVDADGKIVDCGEVLGIRKPDAVWVIVDCERAVGAAMKLSYRWRQV